MTAGPSPSRSACPRRIAPRRDANSYDDGNITPTAAAATLRGIAGPPRSWGRRVYDFFFFPFLSFLPRVYRQNARLPFYSFNTPGGGPGPFFVIFFFNHSNEIPFSVFFTNNTVMDTQNGRVPRTWYSNRFSSYFAVSPWKSCKSRRRFSDFCTGISGI